MGFRKLCLAAGLVVVASLFFAPGALAWTFSTSGSVTCDRNTGEHVISWSIDNRSEPEALTIRESNRGSVAVGSTAVARGIGQFTERLAGSTTGTVTLTVKGNWPSDKTLRTRSASVTLPAGCTPPPTDTCPNIEGLQTKLPDHFIKDASGNCICEPHVVTITVEKTVEKVVEKFIEVPGPERVVTVAAAPITVEKVVTKIVIKKVKVARKKVRAKKRKKAIRPRVLPFTPK